MGFTNLFFGPKFFHSYLTPAPYVVAGLDLPLVTLQAGADLVPMIPVRDAAGRDTVLFGKYGVGVTILPSFLISAIGELNGLVPIMNADAYNALFVSGGLQLKLLFFKASAAVQVPLIEPSKKDLGTIGGVDVGTLAGFNLIGRLMFSF